MNDCLKEMEILEAIKNACRGSHPGMRNKKSFDDLGISWQKADQIFQINYKVSQQYITLSKRLACRVPREEESDLFEILNYLNSIMLSCYALFHPKEKTVELRSGMYVIDRNFDQKAFQKQVFLIQTVSRGLFPILKEFFMGLKRKEEVLEEIEQRSFLSLNLICDDGILRKHATDSPYRLHAGDMKYPLPAHTHGLSEIGMPEFILDVKTFWDEGDWDGRTHSLIDGAYQYFSDPKNRGKLDLILKGKTIKILRKDLVPNSKNNGRQVYCFKELPSALRAVKRLYEDEGIRPGMRLVQICVQGGDPALIFPPFPRS